jgi:hypothetical protein
MQFSDGIPPGQYEQRKGKEEFWKLIDSTVGVPFWVVWIGCLMVKNIGAILKNTTQLYSSAPSKNEESKYGKRHLEKA